MELAKLWINVLANADHNRAVMNEESFGPVMAIMVVEDKAEALRHANRAIAR